MIQTLNEQVAQSLQLYLDRGELTGDTFLERQESALQCLEQAEYETDKFDIQETVTAWLYIKFAWADCTDCDTLIDTESHGLTIDSAGGFKCSDCAPDYYSCDVCDNVEHADNMVGWDGAPICNHCDELYGATCDTCQERCHADSVEYCCKPRIPCKP